MRQAIRNIVFINVADLLNCFPTDLFSNHNFYIAKPDIWIKPDLPVFSCLLMYFSNS